MWIFIKLHVFVAIFIIMIIRNLSGLHNNLADGLAAFHINPAPNKALRWFMRVLPNHGADILVGGSQTLNKWVSKRTVKRTKGLKNDKGAAVDCGQGGLSIRWYLHANLKEKKKRTMKKSVKEKKWPVEKE